VRKIAKSSSLLGKNEQGHERDERMIYEIKSIPKYKACGDSYAAHGVRERQRIGFRYNGNLLFGVVVGCGSDSLLIEVDVFSF